MSTIIASNVSDGTLSIPTTYVTNGSAKAWVNYLQTTNTVQDSTNVSSVADNATGQFTVNFSSSMANAVYSTSTSCKSGSGLANARTNGTYTLSSSSACSFRAFQIATPDSDVDTESGALVHGDLA